MERAQLKAMAKQQIQGNIGTFFVMTLIIAGVAAVANLIPVVGSIASVFIITPAFSIAMVAAYLKLTKGVQPNVRELFDHFNEFWGAFKVSFFVGLFTALWSLLFWIPGIIKALSYSMSMYILAENPQMGALEAINRSKAMMNGHKMDLFVLQLSFIGWHLLGAFTFGIAYVWITPYISATTANFYNSIKNQPEIF